METSQETARQRLRTALDLFEAGCEMKLMALRRQHPGLAADELERLLSAWLCDKPVPLAEVPGFRRREENS